MKALAEKSSSKNDLTRNPGWMKPPPILAKKNLTSFPGGNPFIQPKLRIGQPNDKYEQEADRVADRVMSMPEPKQSLVNSDSSVENRIQRQTEECPECNEKEEEKEEEDEKTQIQTKQLSNQTPPITPGLQRQVQSMKGGGQPLSKAVRNYFEPRFGTDFSQVRMHTDGKAANAAKSANARAFTIGKDVVFGAGQYSFRTSPGKRLLAHELTHVLQQVGSKGRRNNSQISKTHSLNKIQCDLAKPPPSTKLTPQANLNKTEIDKAIKFNKKRTDKKLAKQASIFKQSLVQLVQDIVGAKITGKWDEQTIKLIAKLQEDFGLKKNGKLDQKTLDLLHAEIKLENEFLAWDRALKVLEVAENEYKKGIEENPQCTNRGKEVDKYSNKRTGRPFPIIKKDKTGVLKKIGGGPCGPPWCAYFIMWCMKKAGVNNPGVNASARSVKNLKPHYKTKVARPLRKGDIFYKKPTGCKGHPCDKTPCAKTCITGTGHVGFILDVTGNQVITIEGNASFPGKDNDGVVKRTRPKSEIEGALRLPFP